MNLIERY